MYWISYFPIWLEQASISWKSKGSVGLISLVHWHWCFLVWLSCLHDIYSCSFKGYFRYLAYKFCSDKHYLLSQSLHILLKLEKNPKNIQPSICWYSSNEMLHKYASCDDPASLSKMGAGLKNVWGGSKSFDFARGGQFFQGWGQIIW